MNKTIVGALAGLLALPAIAFAQIPQTPAACSGRLAAELCFRHHESGY